MAKSVELIGQEKLLVKPNTSVCIAYGVGLKERLPDAIESVAKSVTENGKTKYFIKTNSNYSNKNQLYNVDLGIPLNKTNSSTNMLVWQYANVSEVVYLHYLNYLETNSSQQYKAAQRKLKDG